MRIAILGDALDNQYAGVHFYLRNLLHAMAETNPGHEIFLIRQKENNEFKGITEVVVPPVNLPGNQAIRFFYQLPRTVRKLCPDIAIEPGHFGPFFLPKKIKRSTVIHDLTPLLFPGMHIWHSQLLQRLFLPSILKKADLLITNSAYTSSDLRKHFPFTKGKITPVIPGGDSFFKRIVQPQILAKYQIKKPYLVFIGTIEPRKDLPTLIEAFNLLKKENLPHQLVLVGKRGWQYEATINAIKKSPFKEHIIQPGYVLREELPALISMAEQCVYPSLYEGFGLPILEAMSCETPVVTTNISSLPEVGGDACLYFEKGNSAQLAEQIKRFAKDENLRAEKSKEGLKQAAKFNWNKSAKKLFEALEKLMT